MQSFNGIAFKYDGRGRRIGKGDVTYYYDSLDRLIKTSDGLEFFYDMTGLSSFKYNGSPYFYRKDMMGNIIAILDSSGEIVVEYSYDAWGNHTIKAYNKTIANANPFRYRSYFYDTDTGLYYLKTRYYDPEVGRFINMDAVDNADPETLGGLNLYAYCNNNPVSGYDPYGTWDWNKFWGWVVTAAVAVTAVALLVVGTVATCGLLSAVLVGAGAGALMAMGGSIVSQGGFAKSDPWQVAKAGGIGAAIGAVSGAFSYGMGIVGASIGESLGMTFSSTTHIASGIQFGKIFGTSTLTTIGMFFGDIVGGIIGGTGANYFANKLFGTELDYNETIIQGIEGELPMWLIRFFNWL